MTSTETAKIKCPYFMQAGEKTILCEGSARHTTARMRFKTIKDQTDHIDRYCKDRYGRCLHCRAVNLKYEEADDESY